jgi:hypothetical protein
MHLLVIRSSNHFYEQCHGPNSLGEDCNTIRWQKGSSKSPSISPLSTTPSLHLGGPTTATAFVPATQSRATMAQGKCGVDGCGQSRIAQDCKRQLRREHCRDLGGCSSKYYPPKTPNRTAPVAPPFFMPPLPSQPPFPLPSTATGYGPPIPSSLQQPLPPTLPISPANSSLDAHPNPRYASLMPPIFTEQWQREQELAEENRKRDA